MLREGTALLGILLLLPMLMLSVRTAGRRLGLSGELKRKAVHVGMGLTCLAFPWLFSSWTWVAGLCAGSLVVMGGMRWLETKSGAPSVLHDVARQSWGEICFPVAVVAVFALAEGEAWRYVIPILILTLADAAGALVGMNYGKQKFRVFSGLKTTEGSLLVFFVAFLSVHVPLLLMTGIGRSETLLIGLIVAILAMLVEAVSVRGLDNFILPVMVALVLPNYAGLEQGALLLRLAVAAGLLVVVLLGRKDSSLEGGALLASVLLGYAVYIFGDWRFLVPPLILFGEHLLVSRGLRKAELSQPLQSNDLWVIIGLGWAFAPSLVLATCRPAEDALALRSLATAATIHLACVHYTTRLFVLNRPGNEWMRQRAVARAALLVLLPGYALSGWDGKTVALAMACFLLTHLGLLAFRFLLGNPENYPNNQRRWLVQGSVSLGGSVALWAFDYLVRT